MSKEHVELIGGIAAAISTFGGIFLFWLKNKDAFYNSFQGKIKIQSKQNKLFDKYPNLKRILTLQSKNGGGMPRKESKIKISIDYESCDLNKESGLIKDWQEILVDNEYYKMLSRMIEACVDEDSKPYYEFESSILNENGMLKMSLDAQGVKNCRVYYVGKIYWRLFWIIPLVPKKMIHVGFNHAETPDNDPVYELDCLAYVEFLRKELI